MVSKNGSKPITEQYGNTHGRTWSKTAVSVCVAGRGLQFRRASAELGGMGWGGVETRPSANRRAA